MWLVDRLVDIFYEKIIFKKCKPVSGKILEIIKEKYEKPVKIKIIDNKNIHWAQKPLFSSTIYVSKGFWDVLTLEEKLAVIFHEIGHEVSRIKYLFFTFPIPFILISTFFPYPLNIYLLLIWLFGRGLAITVCPISLKGEEFADDFAAEKVGKKNLVNALKKFKTKNKPSLQKWLFNIFIYPFKTHPDTEERIKRLEEKYPN